MSGPMVYPNDYLGPLYGQAVDGHDPGERMCTCMRARARAFDMTLDKFTRTGCVRALSPTALHVSSERQDVAQMLSL